MLRPNEIDSKGRLKEWAEEEREYTPDMVHTSHLYGVFPGNEITWRSDQAIFKAAQKSLQERIRYGADGFGWPIAWHIALNARFKDKDLVDAEIQKVLKEGLTRSFLNKGAVFQIDGNLGLLAGMTECLLQSHDGIEFLPALPVSWKNGKVNGLKARGDVEVSMEWRNGNIITATVRTDHAGEREFIGKVPKISCEGMYAKMQITEYGYCLMMEAGKEYKMNFA